jgi:heme-degrading monooxygenase HmoA
MVIPSGKLQRCPLKSTAWKVRAGEEEIFIRAWTRSTRAIRDTAKGARGSLLLRNQNDPS